MVFIDDSEFEINLVNSQLPQVKSIWLDINKPTEFARMLNSLRYFDKVSITKEDTLRSKMYQEEIERKQFKLKNLDDYFSSMEIKAQISLANEIDISRIAQQTQKTNQFNLTTKRFSETDIRELISSDENDIIVIRVCDRFGDMGLVGTAILEYKNNHTTIDTFLLSCRALGRKIEIVFLNEILQYCLKSNKLKVTAKYLKTDKNSQVETFYEDNNFKNISSLDAEKSYSLALNSTIKCPVSFISVDNKNLYENK